MEFTKQAVDLPPFWDDLVKGNVYMSRQFLQFMESVNNCNQEYGLCYQDKKPVACFVVFKKKYDLFTFTDLINLPVEISFIYLPLSVSEAGIKFNLDIGDQLKTINGLKIILNTHDDEDLSNFVKGNHLPTCVMDISWESLEEYFAALRSNYRHRCKKALKVGKSIEKRLLENTQEFSREMYGLYEQVYDNSKYKLEKLEYGFFKNDFSKIIVFEVDDHPEAFVQLIENGDQLIFEFGGFNYQNNHRYDLYANMLLTILEYGINNKFKKIDFGQTAEDAKLKLGCYLDKKFLLISHSNRFLNFLLKRTIALISYKQKRYDFNPFRKEGES
jgi:hypothetical protein